MGMVNVGNNNTGEEHCRNGAEKYLVVGGAVQLTFNLLLLAVGISVLTETPILNLFAFLLALATIAQVVVFFWGSVVVFGSYAKWTIKDDFQNATYIETEDPAYKNFCKYEPMMFAFVQLIISW